SAPGSVAGLMPMYDAESMIYDDERRGSDSLSHRKHDLEALAVKLQLGERQDSVWRILDEHHAALPEVGAQTEADRLWRLALHRMDVRTYRPQLIDAEAAEETSDRDATETDADRQGRQVYFLPGPVDTDLQEILDRHAPVQTRHLADMALFIWGMAAWRRDVGDSTDANAWREKLAEAHQCTADGTDITDYARGGPGFVAAVCVRDH